MTTMIGFSGFYRRSHNVIANDMFDVFNRDLWKTPNYYAHAQVVITRAIVNWIDEEPDCLCIPTAQQLLAMMEFVELADWFVTT